MLTFALWLAVGVAAGTAGRAIVPAPPKKSKVPRAPITTLAVLGAIVAGMIGDIALRAGDARIAPDYASVVTATVGAAAVVLIARAIQIVERR